MTIDLATDEGTNNMRLLRFSLVRILLTLACVTPAEWVRSEEPAKEFLAQLRERGYFDMAAAYLEGVQENPAVSQEFKANLPYEIALSEAQRAMRVVDREERFRAMERAQQKFAAFLETAPEGAPRNRARSWLGRIQLDQARSIAAKAEAESDAGQRRQIESKAVSLFDEAERSFQEQVANLKDQILELRKSGDVSPSERDRLQNAYLQARFAVAEIRYAKAGVRKSNPGERKSLLQSAADEFGDLGDKYGKRLVGLQSLVLRGKCLQELGEYQKALSYYEEFLDPGVARGPLQNVSAQAMRYTLECLASEKLNQLERAIETGEKWLDAVGETGAGVESVQEVQLELARLQLNQAKQTGDKRLLTDARRNALPISRRPGPRQLEARRLLAEMPGNDSSTSLSEIDSYEDAKLAGDDAYDALQANENAVRLIQGRLSSISDEGERKTLQEELVELNRQSQEKRREAAEFYRRSLVLAPRSLAEEDRNNLRFRLCYLSYLVEDYFDAAAIGEVLAFKYPEFSMARSAASITMASFMKIYGDGSNPAAVEFAGSRTIGIADYLAATWPNQKEAQDALVTLVSFMVSNGETDRARQYLDKIPADSPRRGEAELRTGQSIWSRYLQQIRDGREANEALRGQALELLARGIENMKQSGNSSTVPPAALALSQIYVAMEQSDKAIELLRDPDMGPVTLVEKGDPAAAPIPFQTTAYTTLLRAYLGQLSDAQRAEAAKQGVQSAMERLQAIMGDAPDGRQRLVATYVGLARDLQEQLTLLQPNSKKALAKGFESFLDRVSAEATDFNVLYWIAETFYQLGETFEEEAGGMPDTAQQYFGRAAESYQSILAKSEAGSFEIADNYRIQLRMRRASAMSRLGDFDQAIDEFEQVLIKRNAMINVQIEAAEAIQAGAVAGKTALFNEAVNGTRRNNNTGKNTIWGWSRIGRIAQAQMARGEELRSRFEPIFFDAQYHVAECRYLQAMSVSGDQRSRYLNSAGRTIRFLQGSYSELGGEKQKQAFEVLLQKIEEASKRGN